jgi:hypothetical protein
MLEIWLVIDACAPLPIASRATTEATPIMIPSIVRIVRSLLARRLVSAIRTLSHTLLPDMSRMRRRGRGTAAIFFVCSILPHPEQRTKGVHCLVPFAAAVPELVEGQGRLCSLF